MPTSLDIYKNYLRQQYATDTPTVSGAMERADTQAGLDIYQPSPAPKRNPFQYALGAIGLPFQKLQEHVFTPLSAVLQAGAYGGYQATAGMNPVDIWKAYQPGGVASELYQQWQAPGFEFQPLFRLPWTPEEQRNKPWRIDTKGVVENLPWLFLPAIGKIGQKASLIGKIGELGKAGRLAGRALELTPPALAERAFGSAVGGVGKLATNSIAKITNTIPKLTKTGAFFVAPSSQELRDQLLRTNWQRRIGEWFGRKPVLKGLVEAVGGKQATLKGTQEIEDYTTQALLVGTRVEETLVNQMAAGMSTLRTLHPDPMKMFGVDDATGIATRLKPKPQYKNASLVMADVLEHPQKYIFDDPKALQYIDTLHAMHDKILQAMKDEGVDVAELAFDKFSHYVHRVVKGKMVDGKLVEARKGLGRIGAKQSFEKARFYEQALDGLESGLVYSGNPEHVLALYARSAAKRISDQRIIEMIKPLRTGTGRAAFYGTEATIQHPAFGGSVFPKEVAQQVENYWADHGFKPLQRAAEISGAMRTMVAAADFSAMFIQGAPMAFRHPIAWAKGAAMSFRAFKDPQLYQKYLLENSLSLNERAMYGGFVGGFETMEAVPFLRTIGRKVAGSKGEAAVRQSYGRFEASFGAFGDVARNEMWKALKKTATSQNDLYDMARHIDRLTGVLSTKGLGIGRTQRDFESAFLFFAPRYTRAGFSLISDVFKGGYTGMEARRAIGSMMAGGAAMYSGIAMAMGQQPNFDPSNARFMTIEVTDPITGEKRHMGVGGMMTSLMRFGADVVATTMHNPEDLFIPFKDGKLNRFDNPFIRFMYSKASPLTGTMTNLIEGTNYFGEPFESPEDYAKFMAGQVLPISIQSMMLEEGGMNLSSFMGEELGLRTFPEAVWEQRDALRNQLAQQHFQMNWADLAGPNGPGKLVQRQIEDSSPELQDLVQKSREYSSKVGKGEGDVWDAWYDDGKSIEERYQEAVTRASAEFRVTRDGVAFKDKVNDAALVRRAMYDARNKNPLYKEQIAYYNLPLDEGDRSQMSPLDVARRDYYELMYADDMFDEFGNYNFDLADAKKKAFAARYGPQAVEYIEKFTGIKWNETPELQALKESKKLLEPYFAIERAIWSAYPPEYKQISDQIQIMERTDPAAAKRILRMYPGILMARDRISMLKMQMKQTNPDIKIALATFYSY